MEISAFLTEELPPAATCSPAEADQIADVLSLLYGRVSQDIMALIAPVRERADLSHPVLQARLAYVSDIQKLYSEAAPPVGPSRAKEFAIEAGFVEAAAAYLFQPGSIQESVARFLVRQLRAVGSAAYRLSPVPLSVHSLLVLRISLALDEMELRRQFDNDLWRKYPAIAAQTDAYEALDRTDPLAAAQMNLWCELLKLALPVVFPQGDPHRSIAIDEVRKLDEVAAMAAALSQHRIPSA